MAWTRQDTGTTQFIACYTRERAEAEKILGDFRKNPTRYHEIAAAINRNYRVPGTAETGSTGPVERTFIESYVYLVANAANSLIKIGSCSGEVRVRLKALQTGSPVLLWITGLVPFPTREAASAAEMAAHRQYRDKRELGEWLSVSPQEALQFLSRPGVIFRRTAMAKMKDEERVVGDLFLTQPESAAGDTRKTAGLNACFASRKTT